MSDPPPARPPARPLTQLHLCTCTRRCAEAGSPLLRSGCVAAFALNVSGGTGEELLALVAELRPETPVADAQLHELCRGIADAVREPAPSRLCACPPLPATKPFERWTARDNHP